MRTRCLAPPARSQLARRDDIRELDEIAARLADLAPGYAAEREDLSREWSGRVDRLAKRGVDAGTLAQARALGPVAWLVWTVSDGDIDLAGILPAG